MKIIFSEYLANYKTYSYAYGVYAILENLKNSKELDTELGEIYNNGFLPYSGSADLQNHFYLCRSLRVNLAKWKLNSENKRIQKKQSLKLNKKVFKSFKDLEKKEYEEIFSFYLNYFKNIHGEKIMPHKRLEFIFMQKFVNRIVTYRNDGGKLIGSILMIEGNKNLHFWFSAYDESVEKTGFGLWMMLDEIEESIKRKINYFYLGTCYGEKAKYKLNFEALEFFDGAQWNSNLKELKERIKMDTQKDKEFDLLKADKSLF